jgi:glycosyltransferase involved in cell wall biosynthesis
MGEVLGEARWPYLQGADLFCLPSHSENFGLAVLEACQVGTPVLTTTETPWAEPLTGRPGFICQPTVESIRLALDRFWSTPLASPDERAALSDWAWTTFNWKTLAPRYVDFYATLANS